MDTCVARHPGAKIGSTREITLLNGLLLAFLLTPVLMLAVSVWQALMQRFGISAELVGPCVASYRP